MHTVTPHTHTHTLSASVFCAAAARTGVIRRPQDPREDSRDLGELADLTGRAAGRCRPQPREDPTPDLPHVGRRPSLTMADSELAPLSPRLPTAGHSATQGTSASLSQGEAAEPAPWQAGSARPYSEWQYVWNP